MINISNYILEGDPKVSFTIGANDLKEVITDMFALLRQKEGRNTVNEPDSLMTREEASKLLSINFSTLWRWSKDGYLTPVKIGRKCYYRKSDIQSMMAKGVPCA